jgi:uncharacterized protein (TIGR02453 family)
MHHYQPEKENILTFLKDLTENNNRQWFKTNKEDYDDAMDDFLKVVLPFSEEVRLIDASIKEDFIKNYVFRIFRDIRFSKDKSPYKNHFGAYVANGGRKSEMAGYYIHIQPNGETMIGGGVYGPQKEVLKSIRDEIYFNSSKLRAILEAPEFVKHFGKLEGSQLKNGPKDFPKDHEAIDLLKYKDFVAMKKYSDEAFLSEGFFDDVLEACKAAKPLNDFLNEAILMKEDQ